MQPGNDQLFKAFLRLFLPEFFFCFFPEKAALIDWSTLEFMDKELFTLFPQGDQRTVDLLAKVRSLDGREELLLIHVEIESSPRPGFPLRMFEYYMLIRMRHGLPLLPVLPVAIFLSRGYGGIGVDHYTEEVLGWGYLRYEYQRVALPDISAADLDPANLVRAALLPFFRDRPADPVELLVDSYVALVRAEPDVGRQNVALGFVDSYVATTAEQTNVIWERLRDTEAEQLLLRSNRWRKLGLEEGREEGLNRGISLGLREALADLATERFGSLPDSFPAALATVTSAEDFRAARQALAASQDAAAFIEALANLAGKNGDATGG